MQMLRKKQAVAVKQPPKQKMKEEPQLEKETVQPQPQEEKEKEKKQEKEQQQQEQEKEKEQILEEAGQEGVVMPMPMPMPMAASSEKEKDEDEAAEGTMEEGTIAYGDDRLFIQDHATPQPSAPLLSEFSSSSSSSSTMHNGINKEHKGHAHEQEKEQEQKKEKEKTTTTAAITSNATTATTTTMATATTIKAQYAQIDIIDAIKCVCPQIDAERLTKWKSDLRKEDIYTLQDMMTLETEALQTLSSRVSVKCYDCLLKLNRKCSYLIIGLQPSQMTGTLPFARLNGIYVHLAEEDVYDNQPMYRQMLSSKIEATRPRYCLYFKSQVWRVYADNPADRDLARLWICSSDNLFARTNSKKMRWAYYCTQEKKNETLYVQSTECRCYC